MLVRKTDSALLHAFRENRAESLNGLSLGDPDRSLSTEVPLHETVTGLPAFLDVPEVIVLVLTRALRRIVTLGYHAEVLALRRLPLRALAGEVADVPACSGVTPVNPAFAFAYRVTAQAAGSGKLVRPVVLAPLARLRTWPVRNLQGIAVPDQERALVPLSAVPASDTHRLASPPDSTVGALRALVYPAARVLKSRRSQNLNPRWEES